MKKFTKRTLAHSIHWSESLILLAATYYFWYPSAFPGGRVSGIDRADYFWVLGLLIPVLILRFFVRRRLWTHTPLDFWLFVFLILGVINVEVAPYPSRGPLMLMRPLLGMALLLHLAETARLTDSLARNLQIMIILGLLVAVVALGATQWNEKSDDFRLVIDQLPRIEPFFAPGGFNANEIAGAMAWLIPLMAGLVVHPWQKWRRFWQFAAGVAFLLLLVALIFGQSRSAIIGVFVALVGIALVVYPSGRWRHVALGGMALLVMVQVVVTLNVLGSDSHDRGLSDRDERTAGQRLAIWDSAWRIVRDYPLTGVGMNHFRYGPVRERYPIIGMDVPESPDQRDFERRFVPHAHNEFVQIATDLGVPGLAVFVAWYGVTAYMLWFSWQHGDRDAKVVAGAVAGGLLAHLAYGMSDAIPLWDRFSFVFWLMLGLAAAQYTLLRRPVRQH